ncbi:MAG: alpha/beta hydrolase [Myxococcota bacterium]
MNAWKDAAEAALNAVVGDRLEASGNPLRIQMGLYERGRPLDALPAGDGRLCVLVHGMGCTENCWQFPRDPDVDYGRLLERGYGLTPLYVRYNTGLPIWDNGQRLAGLLESVVRDSPVAVQSLTLIGHSLGGLVIRSALHQAEHALWARRTERAFYIGTPHRGSPLERAGRWARSALGNVPEPVTQMLGDLSDQRSAAIKNLGDGDIVDGGATIPLADGVDHFVVAGALPQALLAQVLGDGLVPVDSAAGRDPSATLGMFEGLHHMDLAHAPEVYAWIAERVGAPRASEPVPPRVREEEKARLLGVLELLGEAVDEGSSAIQRAHEAIAERPYDILEDIPPLRAPTRLVRAGHFAVLRGTYGAIRGINDLLRRPRSRSS